MRQPETRCAWARGLGLKRDAKTLHLRAMGERAVRILFGVLCVSGSSRAESRLQAHELVQTATDASGLRRLVTSPSEWLLGFNGGMPGARSPGNRVGLRYRSVLGALVITRDLRLPGASFLALRLIPTRRALGGELEAPIVLRPRLLATSWYGFDALVRF